MMGCATRQKGLGFLLALFYFAFSVHLYQALPVAGRAGLAAYRVMEGRCPVCGMRASRSHGLMACMDGVCCCHPVKAAGKESSWPGQTCFQSGGCQGNRKTTAPGFQAQMVPQGPGALPLIAGPGMTGDSGPQAPSVYPDPPEKIPWNA